MLKHEASAPSRIPTGRIPAQGLWGRGAQLFPTPQYLSFASDKPEVHSNMRRELLVQYRHTTYAQKEACSISIVARCYE